MDYSKKVLVIKEVLQGFSSSQKGVSGIARIESENGVGELHLTLINVLPATKGDYYVYLIDCLGNFYAYLLPKRPMTFTSKILPCPNLLKGFSAGLCYVENFIPSVVCFGKTEDSNCDYNLFSKKVAEKWLLELKNQQKEEKSLSECQEVIPKEIVSAYDDEAVATENYFLQEEKIQLKLDKIKEYNRERISFEDEYFTCNDQTQKTEDQKDAHRSKNEANFDECQNPKEYYISVKKELDNIFENFSQDLSLTKTFPDSKWAKIHYSKDKYYVVGLIKECGVEKYICYGVPDIQNQTPPKELKDFCLFLPLPDKEDQGFWMMFQDAKTGKCVMQI